MVVGPLVVGLGKGLKQIPLESNQFKGNLLGQKKPFKASTRGENLHYLAQY